MRIWSLFHYFKLVLTVKSVELILWADRFLLEGTFSLSLSHCMARHSDHGQRMYVNRHNKMFSRSLSQSLSAPLWSIKCFSSKRWTYKTHNNNIMKKRSHWDSCTAIFTKNKSQNLYVIKFFFFVITSWLFISHLTYDTWNIDFSWIYLYSSFSYNFIYNTFIIIITINNYVFNNYLLCIPVSQTAEHGATNVKVTGSMKYVFIINHFG